MGNSRGESYIHAMTGMNKVVEAADRLEQAVLRLESVFSRRRGALGNRDVESALAEAKAQCTTLARTTQTVATRLDRAIGRLDRALEE